MHLGHSAGGTAGTVILGLALFVLGVAMVLRSRYE
jgi:hypothetical protein